MDRVKKYWQEIIKEREVFWSSFFSKYQEDKTDVDVRSYMDNSSSRVSTLLELATEDDKEPVAFKVSNSKVIQYFEEQSSESSGAYSVEASTPLNIDQEEPKDENLKSANLPVVLAKRVEPTFVFEINSEEEDAEHVLSRNSHSAKKFKLFESPSQFKENVEDTVINDQSNNVSVNFDSNLLSESTVSPVSEESDSFQKLICRRLKSRSKHVSSPKRFKLI